MHDAVLLYAREVAFATADVYARAAEVRGAWDARLEALVVDSVVRAEADEARAVARERAGLGGARRRGRGAGRRACPPGRDRRLRVRTPLGSRRRAWTRCAPPRATGSSSCWAASTDPLPAATRLLDHFGDGPVVVGPVTADLAHAHASARAALSAHRAASGWPDAPRPVASRDLLPERALAGDGHARRHLVDEVYLPLVAARGTLLETLSAYFEHGSSIEATARALFVHPNTVRYRLRQISDAHGLVTRPAHARRSRSSWR